MPCPEPPFHPPTRVVLTGLMAAGKSTVGRRLAADLGWPLVDTDAWVMHHTGRSPAEIFAREGEAVFRRLESLALAEALKAPRVVVAAGGGAVVDPINRALMARAACIVHLSAPPAVLAGRAERQGTASRPLLVGKDVQQELERLQRERRAFYLESDFTVDTSDLTPEAAARAIGAALGLGRSGEVGSTPPTLRRVVVPLGERSYPVWIGPDLLGALGDLLQVRIQDLGRGLPARALVVCDGGVRGSLGERVIRSLEAVGVKAFPVTVPPGEPSKSLEQAARLYDAATAAHLDRNDVVVAVGGGMVGDLAGFVAATYGRGTAWIQVPTTLLAQVDAGVGGKTGINHRVGKNLIGAFHQPLFTAADTGVLRGLPLREWRSGMAEAVKHAFLAGGRYHRFIADHAAALARPDAPVGLTAALVAGSVAIKAAVVAADEREEGPRAVLNLGHTFGHALERVTGYGVLSHGEAVAVGMAAATALAARLGLLEPADRRCMLELLQTLGLPTDLPVGVEAGTLLAAAGQDKKRRAGVLRWVLPHGFGQVGLHDGIPLDVVTSALRAMTPDDPTGI